MKKYVKISDASNICQNVYETFLIVILLMEGLFYYYLYSEAATRVIL